MISKSFSTQMKISMGEALSELLLERIDDLIYSQLLIISFFFSMIMRQIRWGIVREICGGLIGVSLIYYFIGWKLLYSLIIVILNIIINSVMKNRYLPLASFIITFVYLGFLRIIHLIGFPALVSHSNAVQLIMTLRLVGLSFEIADSRRKDEMKFDLTKTRFIEEPSWWQTFLYSYNFPGLFTGPYYTYAMYRDVIDNDDIMEISVWEHIKWRLYNFAWSLPAFLLLLYAFPLEMMRKDEFFDETVYYRISVSFLVFLWMRCRVYSAWMVAESICVLNGIGIYPEESCPSAGKGPNRIDILKEQINRKGTKYNSEAIRNLDIWSIELNASFRGGMRAWNRTVQFWLANCVYKRVPRSMGVLLTMLVSAFWHGVHPGYFLSFLTVPLCTLAEDNILSLVPKDSNGKLPLSFTVFWYIIRQLGFTLMASGFLLLTWRDTIRYWNSVYFHVHWIMITIILLSWLYKSLMISAASENSFKTNIKMKSNSNEFKKEEAGDWIVKKMD
ncbi:MBOAT family protein [Brugia malayi]|uniref:Lysophospholipid acyltransferase 7 n=1 Tax=Brugia malayi TaxID=6279 RepID=A0A4E9FA78_BRUMA|nr:MBOAT family protein [Brugia malayi]VIO93055.1 MBOAT family protein [Brugia malayi]